MVIDDTDRAGFALQKIGFHRFVTYAAAREVDGNPKIPGIKGYIQHPNPTQFSDIEDIIDFDERLSDIIFQGTRIVEHWIKGVLEYDIANRLGSTAWYNDKQCLRQSAHDSREYLKLLDEINKRVEIDRQRRLPAAKPITDWMSANPRQPIPLPILGEVFDLKIWGFLYSLLKEQFKVDISTRLDYTPEQFLGHLRAISDMRNACAHHDILWNREYLRSPSPHHRIRNALSHYSFLPDPKNGRELIARRLYTIHNITKHVAPESLWTEKMKAVMLKAPDLRAMGFKNDWSNPSIWS